MFWPISGVITSGLCYLTPHCKKKWVAILVTSASYPFPHNWTISFEKYSSMAFTGKPNQVLHLFGIKSHQWDSMHCVQQLHADKRKLRLTKLSQNSLFHFKVCMWLL